MLAKATGSLHCLLSPTAELRILTLPPFPYHIVWRVIIEIPGTYGYFGMCDNGLFLATGHLGTQYCQMGWEERPGPDLELIEGVLSSLLEASGG